MTDAESRRLLVSLQTDFPLVARPYAELARRFGTDETTCLEQIRRFHADGTIRRLGAVFDVHRLGFVSTLVALLVSRADLASVIEELNDCPFVTHNYVRTGAYPIWAAFVAPNRLALSHAVEHFVHDRRVVSSLDLPATGVYKIRAVFGGESDGGICHVNVPFASSLTENDRPLLARLSGDILPAGACPFSDLELQRLSELRQEGVIRRIGALLDHRKLGLAANALTVWRVPTELCAHVGELFAMRPDVSHCYARKTRAGWPYTLYAMLHAADMARLTSAVRELAAIALSVVSAPVDHDALVTLRECKKASPQIASFDVSPVSDKL